MVNESSTKRLETSRRPEQFKREARTDRRGRSAKYPKPGGQLRTLAHFFMSATMEMPLVCSRVPSRERR
jgi:hypothetical protein